MRKFEYYSDDIENVENYELAKADDFKGWCCHHRLELVSTGGVCDVDRQDLIDWDIYYHRPASELIFLRRSEHMSLHMKGKAFFPSEETKRKMSEAHKGKKIPPFSEEHKKKMSEALKGRLGTMKGKHHSDETRKKMTEARKKLSEAYKKDNKGLSWNEFQHKYKNNY